MLKRALLYPFVAPEDILSLMTKQFGKDWLLWEPQTIRDELSDIGIRADALPPGNWDKLLATKAAILSGAPWEDWDAFLNFAQAFNGLETDFRVARICSPSETAWTVHCLGELKPEEKFSDEVANIIACILLGDGITIAPPELDFVDGPLAMLQMNNLGAEPFRELAKERYELCEKQGSVPQEDDPLSIHTVKLLAIRDYVVFMKAKAEAIYGTVNK